MVPSIISPNNTTVISNVQVKRMNEMMANDEMSWCFIIQTNSLKQNNKKHGEQWGEYTGWFQGLKGWEW